MKHNVIKLACVISLCASSAYAADLTSCRASINAMYHDVINSPTTPWLTRLYMRCFPVQVKASPRPLHFQGQCGFRTITLNLESIKLLSPRVVRSLLTHEFMHYKHMHALKALAVVVPVTWLTIACSIKLREYLASLYEKNRNKRFSDKPSSLSDLLLKSAVIGIPLTGLIASWIFLLRLVSHREEFQADSSEALYTGDFEASLQSRLEKIPGVKATKRPMGKIEGFLFNATYPSGESCAKNIAHTAERYRFEKLQAQCPSTDTSLLKQEACDWAQSLLQSALRKYRPTT